MCVDGNPTLFRSWNWRDLSEEGAGGRVRLVQLSLKVMFGDILSLERLCRN